MLKVLWIVYGITAVGMLTTTIVTGRRATAISGEPHYFATVTSIYVEEEAPAESETDAAFDAAFEEAETSTTLRVKKPVFVLGLMDATLPTIAGGGFLLGGVTLVGWFRRRRARIGKPTAENV